VSLPRVLLEVSGLLTLAVLLSLVARRVRLPLTVVLVVVGFLAAAIGVIPGLAELEGEAFEEIVVFAFLPLLVFAAALGIDLRAFLRNLVSILALAIPAFLLSAVLVGGGLHLLVGTGLGAAFLFGALISATDPVAVVAIFRELGVPRRLLTLVEGESLFNDGVAIVAASILLEAAVGGSVSVLAGVLDFLLVFAGGALIGILVGLVAAMALPWLDRLPAVALSLAVAYGSFVLADEVLGFSGVMATAAAGMVLAGLAPSRATAEVREMLEQLWEALDYTANALLFLLIGLVIGPDAIIENIVPILVAVGLVLAARALAVVPIVFLLERVAHIPRVGWRNESVLIWGGLRGGVALALALSLPEDLAERELLVALTGGVVLATLLLNATTIRALVHRLGLDQPSRSDRFLAAIARLTGIRAARRELDDLAMDQGAEVVARLTEAEDDAQQQLSNLELDEGEQVRVVIGRGLAIERMTYQQLSDQGLIAPVVTRSLLHEVDDELEELTLRGAEHQLGSARQRGGQLDRMGRRVVHMLPEPAGEDPADMAYAEATARRIAARRTGEAFEVFERVPAIRPETVEAARSTFAEWEQEAVAELEELDTRSASDVRELHRRQARTLALAASTRELNELAELGLLPEQTVMTESDRQVERPGTAPI